MSGFNLRRDVLKGGATGVTGLATLLGGTASADPCPPADATLQFDDQESDGERVTLSALRTKRAGTLYVVSSSFEVLAERRVPARTEWTDRDISLADPLTADQHLHAILFDRAAGLVDGETASIEVSADEPATITFDQQESDGTSVVIDHLWTSVDASLFVFDEAGDTIGGSGVTFDAGEDVESLSVALDDPLESSQEVTVSLHESGAGPITEATALVEVTAEEPASLTVADQESDGSSIVINHVRTQVDASLFVFDEAGDEIGGSGVRFDAGEAVTGLPVALDDPLEASQEVTVTLYESNGGPIAEATAMVSVSDGETGSIGVDDQSSDGTVVEIASLRTPVDAALFIFDESGDDVGDGGFEAGDELESYPVELETPLSSSQEITAKLYESNGGPIAEDAAYVTVE